MAKVVTLTVEASIDSGFIFDADSIVQDLEGEWVKVKSGAYDNAVMGIITGAKITGEEEDHFTDDEDEAGSGPAELTTE